MAACLEYTGGPKHATTTQTRCVRSPQPRPSLARRLDLCSMAGQSKQFGCQTLAQGFKDVRVRIKVRVRVSPRLSWMLRLSGLSRKRSEHQLECAKRFPARRKSQRQRRVHTKLLKNYDACPSHARESKPPPRGAHKTRARPLGERGNARCYLPPWQSAPVTSAHKLQHRSKQVKSGVRWVTGTVRL